MTEDICTKPSSGQIIIRDTKLMSGFRLYLISDTEHSQIMSLDEFLWIKLTEDSVL